MTRRVVFGIALALCALLLAASATSAQSLAEVAKKEKERRKSLTKSDAPMITDVELRRASGPVTSVTSVTGGADATTSPDGESATDGEEAAAEEPAQDDPTRTQAYWRDRLNPIDERIRALEARLQSPELTQNPLGASERQRVERDLDSARADRQRIIDEGRRAGVPPGWLR